MKGGKNFWKIKLALRFLRRDRPCQLQYNNCKTITTWKWLVLAACQKEGNKKLVYLPSCDLHPWDWVSELFTTEPTTWTPPNPDQPNRTCSHILYSADFMLISPHNLLLLNLLKPHLTSFLAWHILDTAGLVVFYRYGVHRGTVSQSTVFPHGDTRNVWFLILECTRWWVSSKSFSHIYDTLCLFKKIADFGWETCVCLHVCSWIVNISIPNPSQLLLKWSS